MSFRSFVSLLLLLLCCFFFVIPVSAKALPFGDVSLGEKVTLTDAKLIAAYFKDEQALSEGALLAGDVNFDGKTELLDALIIALYADGAIPVLGSGRILPDTKSTVLLSVGERKELTALIPTTLPAVRWSVTNPAMISVSSDGAILAKKEGEAAAIASLPGGQSATFPLRIERARTARGMDVSEFQGQIDWQQVKDSRLIDFAILRAGSGYAGSNVKDADFDRNCSEANAAGIPLGAYFYAVPRSISEAKDQARQFLSFVSGKKLSYPLVMDLEDELLYDLSQRALTDLAIAFLQELQDAGYQAMLYTDLDFYENRLEPDRLTGFDLWLADDSAKPPRDKIPYQIWQYTDRGRIPGVPERVDLDIAYAIYEL